MGEQSLQTIELKSRKPVWPYVTAIYLILFVWVSVAFTALFGLPSTALLPLVLVLYYLWWLLPLVAAAAGLRIVSLERLTRDSSASQLKTWPYVFLALTAVAATLFSLAGGVLSPKGLAELYYVAGDSDGYSRNDDISYFWDKLQLIHVGFFVSIFVILAIAVACIAIRSGSKARVKYSANAPVGHTTDGQPIYPVVGYTPDGQPVTADRAVGLQPHTAGTNTMAIVALITGLTIAPLGIVFGHIALSQIKRTWQDGRGLAIAGLVLGYLGLGFSILTLILIAAGV
ncbi:DUF4190 domain-containing protein [Mycolicibacterium sp. PDY-3]|uniref:DUF4190 domain-containing protein n=1 Tax=Mycolicibacterium sp. PDY-3 TaxID=3376069 RepID=UPI003795BE58